MATQRIGSLLLTTLLFSIPSVVFGLTEQQFKDDFIRYIGQLAISVNNGRDIKVYNTSTKFGANKNEVNWSMYMPAFTNIRSGYVIPSEISVTNQIDAPVEKKTTMITRCENYLPIQQTCYSPSKTLLRSSTLTHTTEDENHFSFEEGIGVSVKLNLVVVESTITETLKFTQGFKNVTSDSEATTTSESVTYPAQPLTLQPYSAGLVSYEVYPVIISGTFESNGFISGNVRLYPIYYKNEGNLIAINRYDHYGDRNSDYPNAKAYEDMSLYQAYKMIQQHGGILPSYIEFDDQNQRLKIKEPLISKFTVETDVYSDIIFTQIPYNLNEPNVETVISTIPSSKVLTSSLP